MFTKLAGRILGNGLCTDERELLLSAAQITNRALL